MITLKLNEIKEKDLIFPNDENGDLKIHLHNLEFNLQKKIIITNSAYFA